MKELGSDDSSTGIRTLFAMLRTDLASENSVTVQQPNDRNINKASTPKGHHAPAKNVDAAMIGSKTLPIISTLSQMCSSHFGLSEN